MKKKPTKTNDTVNGRRDGSTNEIKIRKKKKIRI
jgi:hypothetical protein